MLLFVREGGVKVVSGIEETDPRPFSWFRGDEFLRLERLGRLVGPSRFKGSVLKEARCWDNMDRFSSIGVKIL